jgi:hypothetical protein
MYDFKYVDKPFKTSKSLICKCILNLANTSLFEFLVTIWKDPSPLVNPDTQ